MAHPEGYWNCPVPGGCRDCHVLANEIGDSEQVTVWNEERAAHSLRPVKPFSELSPTMQSYLRGLGLDKGDAPDPMDDREGE